MPIRNPMHIIDPYVRKKTLVVLILIVLSIFLVFRSLDIPLQTLAAPSGIVSYELAGISQKNGQILTSWDSHAKLFAAFGLGFDYFFMLVYASAISLTCLISSQRHKGWFASLGDWAGWGVFLAAGMDAIENLALWNQLTGAVSSSWSALAAGCATVKFTFIILGVSYALLAGLLPGKNS